MRIKMIAACATALFGAVVSTVASASTIDVTVSSQADIFLAGQSSVPTNFPFNSGTSGLGAGQLPTAISITGSGQLFLSASGTVSCCLGGSPTNGPGGGGLGGSTNISAYGNVAAYSDPVQFQLVGLFGGPGLTKPWSVFDVGAGADISIPSGATTLYLGLADALGFDDVPGYYNDNTGSFSVLVIGPNADLATPLPTTWTLMLIGLVGIGFVAYHGRRQSAVRATA
jgi:hypothetical protein